MQDREQPPSQEEWVPADDAIIGTAFRGSLWVIVFVAVLAGVVFLFIRSRQNDAPPEKELDSVAPVAVEQEAQHPTVAFTDVTAESGIDFVHTSGATGEKLLPETMGSGAAFLDYDGDGDQDLFLVNATLWPADHASGAPPTSALYRNDGGGRFADVTAEAGLGGLSLYATGVATGDYDGDGASDLFLAAVGENRLLRNRDGRFEDVTTKAGVAGGAEEWSSSSSFFDYDGDGDLDLMVCNYVRWSRQIDLELDYRLTGVGRAYGPPVNYQGTYPYLYRNEGDGTFTDVSAASGVQIKNEATDVPVAKALALAPIDVDRDGLIDVLVANDTVRKFFFHNQGDGTFLEMGELYGLAYGRSGEATGAMGVDAGFYRNDSELGFVIGNFANEMTSLYLSQGDPTLYADEAIGEGIGAPSRTLLSFGVLLFDYDLDGRLDILQTNGHLENEINAVDPSQSYEQPAQLFWNAGPNARQGFVAVPLDAMGDLAKPIVGRGSAYADIDADGDLDVVLTQVGQRPLLLRNDQQLGNHWLRVKVVGPPGQREAIGAWLELSAGGVVQRRQVMPTRSYQSQSELPVTFGLGKNARVDSLVVVWPGGGEQQVEVESVDQMIVVEKE